MVTQSTDIFGGRRGQLISTKTYNKIQAVISVMNKRQSRVRRPRMVGIVAGLDGEVREGLPEEVTSEANEGRK